MRGGGSKAVWNFSENSSILEVRGFPKTLIAKITICNHIESMIQERDQAASVALAGAMVVLGGHHLLRL